MRKSLGSFLFHTAVVGWVALVAVAVNSFAAGAPSLRLSDTNNNTITINSAGQVTFACATGPCTTLPTYPRVTATQIDWAGTVGPITVYLTTGTLSDVPGYPLLQLSIGQIFTGDTGGTLTVEFTATGLTTAGQSAVYQSKLNYSRGTVGSTFSAYFDPANAPFQATNLLATLSGIQTALAPGALPLPMGPYSATQVLRLTLGPNSNATSATYQILAVPCGGSIGDFVWSDTNFNGIQDGVETGINGVTIQLYKGSVSPGNLVGTTVTTNAPNTYIPAPGFGPLANAPGYYQFTGLCQGNYIVVADQNLPANQPVLSGFTPSPTFKGGNPALDSNETYAPVTLSTDTSTDETIDFGFGAAPPPTLTCGASTGEVNVPYSTSLLAAGGFPAYTFSATGLPGWLTLTPTTGALNGIPNAPGPLTFTATVVDARNNAAGTTSQSCTITINPPPTLTCSAVNSGEVGVPFNSTPSVTGGVAPLTFSVIGTLPAGLSLDASTGAITGTPTAAGAFSIKVTDANGQVATGTCPFTIVDKPSLTCSAVNSGEVGVPFNSTPSVTGGVAPLTFSVVGTLPAGLSLDASTGAITGTPTAAGTFSIKVTDANGQVATGTCPFTIVDKPSLTCSAVNSGEVGVPFNSTPSVTSGVAPLTFSVVGTLPAGLSLDASTGAITGTPTAAGAFSIKVTDANGQVATGTCPFTIVDKPSLTCSAVNSGEVGVPFNSTPTVTGGVAPLTFSVIGTLPAGLSLDASTGAITGTPTAAGTFSIKVTDANGQVATGTCPFTIVGGPVLTCLATGTTGIVGIPFNAPALTVTGGVAPLTFSVVGTLPAGLSLNPTTGAITGTPTAAGTFSIKVTDANSQVATGTCPYTVYPAISANCVSITAFQGVAITPVTLTANGGVGGSYTFTATGLPAGLTMSTSGTISGTPTVSGTFNYTVTVKDSAGNTGSTGCAVTVTPPPTPINLQCGSCSTSQGKIGIPYSSQLTVTGGTAPFTFSLQAGSALPPGLTLDAKTGLISGTPTKAGTYIFTAVVTDATGQTDTATCTIVIVAPPIDLACGACGASRAIIGTPYSVTLKVTGATTPVTFSLLYGSLPPGLTLNPSTGTISGTPTTAGTYTFKIQAVDANGASDTAICSIVVIASPVNLDCGVCGSGKGYVGKSFSETLVASGGTRPYTFSIVSGSLAPGLTLNTSTGVISGTPTTPGTYTFTAKVVDANGYSDTATCTLVVVYVPINLECGACGTTGGKVGTAYSTTLAISGGKAPYTFSLISGSLPPGLTLNSSTGVISGTPTTPGSYTFTAKVVDANGSSDTATCTIVIAGSSINLDCGLCGGKLTVGVAFTGYLPVTGGTAPFYFSIVYGSLPPGLTLDRYTGKISGTPTTAGTYTFTAKVIDSRGASDTATCTITVQTNLIDLQCGACSWSNGSTGVSYSASLRVLGGTAPFAFSIVSGSLPPGLTLNTSTGLISGTPTTPGYYTFTARVVDSKGAVDTVTCTIVIAPGALDLQCGACGGSKGVVGAAYSSTLKVLGGTPKYTFSIVYGSLPPGLTLNTSTGVISGIPTKAGSYTFTAKVVDSAWKYDFVTCTITIVAPLNLQCGACGSATANVGIPYSGSLQLAGGSWPFTFSIVSGSLPPGLTLNAGTGAITGTPTASGTYIFTSKVVDANGFIDTATCTIIVKGTIPCGSYITYTMGGWGAAPAGNNAGTLLANNFVKVYGSAGVSIGGFYKLKFTSAAAIEAFLPQGTTAGILTGNATNPATSVAGVLAGQVLALQLNVDFSNKGLTRLGLSGLKLTHGALAGQTVSQVLALANQVLGGNTSVLPTGLTITGLTDILDAINNDFDGGRSNDHYLQ